MTATIAPRDGDRRNRDYDRDRGRDSDDSYRDGRYNRDRRDGDRDDPHPSSGYYGNDGYSNYGRGYRNPAYQVGYNDGLVDGERDFRTGHSFRREQQDNFRHADRGYSSSYGNKDAYRQDYRQAYEEGYRSAYGR